MLYNKVEDLVGMTPVVRLERLEMKLGLKAELYAKLEMFNPAGSAKDRIALKMIEDAEKEGIIKSGDIIIEPTSGNTGIGLAAIGAARGYKVIIVMPDSMSIERIKLMKAYGAEVVLTPGAEGMAGAIAKAEQIRDENNSDRSCIIAGQFENPSNWKAHYASTGPELFNDLDGKIDMFVAGIGTGGTITGTGKFLKEKIGTRIVGVEPAASPLITEGHSGPHGLQGIGANFIPDVLNLDVVDDVVTAELDEALELIKTMGATEGLFIGISSAAALSVAIRFAESAEYEGKRIVALLPDGGDRYLSTLEF